MNNVSDNNRAKALVLVDSKAGSKKFWLFVLYFFTISLSVFLVLLLTVSIAIATGKKDYLLRYGLYKNKDNRNHAGKIVPIKTDYTVPTIQEPQEPQEQDDASGNFKWGDSKMQEYGSNPKLPILMYHSIAKFEDIPKNDGNPRLSRGLKMPPQYLRQQLDIIKSRGYTTITFADLDNFINKKSQIPEKSIILSFDDGWEDNIEAYKILKENGMVGSFGIVSSFINAPGRLNTNQIKDMDKNGMEIVSHSVTHAAMANIQQKQLDRELGESKKILEDIIGKPVKTIIYPTGSYNENTIKTAKKLGYTLGVTTKGYNESKGQNILLPFEITRVRVECATPDGNFRNPACPGLGSLFFNN